LAGSPAERTDWRVSVRTATWTSDPGLFSTEAETPGQVEQETREANGRVLGWTVAQVSFVDDLGKSVVPEKAETQVPRLLVP
jgi:hypothetical protein